MIDGLSFDEPWVFCSVAMGFGAALGAFWYLWGFVMGTFRHSIKAASGV